MTIGDMIVPEGVVAAAASGTVASQAASGASVEPEPPRRGRPRSARVEQSIVEATIELLVQHGFGGLSMEAVAVRAGVAKTTIYRRWPGKHELVLDVLARAKGQPVELPPHQSVRDDLIFLLTHTRASQVAHPLGQLLPKLLAEESEHPALAEEYMARVIAPRRERFLNVLRRGVDEGAIRPEADLSVAAEALTAPVLFGSWVTSGPRIRAPQIPQLVDLILAGLSPR